MDHSFRLKPGTAAPAFDVTDVHGRPIRLTDFRGRRLMLSFYRFASCPFCNLRVHRLLQLRETFERNNLSMVAVFQSRAERIRAHVGAQDDALPIVADPENRLYAAYGIEASQVAVVRAAVRRLGDAAMAISKGFLPADIDADKTTVPADFLIDERGIIRVAYYGRDIGDHLPVERIQSYLAVGSDPSVHQPSILSNP
jgi:peroxiredoxin